MCNIGIRSPISNALSLMFHTQPILKYFFLMSALPTETARDLQHGDLQEKLAACA